MGLTPCLANAVFAYYVHYEALVHVPHDEHSYCGRRAVVLLRMAAFRAVIVAEQACTVRLTQFHTSTLSLLLS